MKSSRFVSVVLLLVVVGCGATRSNDTVETTTTEQAIPAISDVTTTESPEASKSEDPTDYLVAMANGAADLAEQLRSHEDEVNEQYLDPSTEDERLAYLEAYYGGESSIYIEYAYHLREVSPPAAFSAAHARYSDTLAEVFEQRLETTEQLTSIEAWAEWLDSLGIATDAYLDFIDACEEMEETAEHEGFALDLSCPAPPPEVVEVRVEVGAGWHAEPDLAPTDGVVLELTITNSGDKPVRVVVLDVFGDDPLNLPLADGLVDLTQHGVGFGIAYPELLTGDDNTLAGPPPEILPGETVTATVWGSGPVVVLDHSVGALERGSYVVIKRAEGTP